jgi:hypothetical protein
MGLEKKTNGNLYLEETGLIFKSLTKDEYSDLTKTLKESKLYPS